jgi:hypothetical protein
VEDIGVEGRSDEPFLLLLLEELSPVEHSCSFAVVDDGDDEERQRFECEIDEAGEADLLVEDLEGEGSHEHGHPADDIDDRNDDLVLVVVLEVLEVHQFQLE